MIRRFSKSIEAITDKFFGVKMQWAIPRQRSQLIIKSPVLDLWCSWKCLYKKKNLWWSFRRSTAQDVMHWLHEQENIFNVSSRRGEERPSLASVWIYSAAKWLAQLSCAAKIQFLTCYAAISTWSGMKTITAGVTVQQNWSHFLQKNS